MSAPLPTHGILCISQKHKTKRSVKGQQDHQVQPSTSTRHPRNASGIFATTTIASCLFGCCLAVESNFRWKLTYRIPTSQRDGVDMGCECVAAFDFSLVDWTKQAINNQKSAKFVGRSRGRPQADEICNVGLWRFPVCKYKSFCLLVFQSSTTTRRSYNTHYNKFYKTALKRLDIRQHGIWAQVLFGYIDAVQESCILLALPETNCVRFFLIVAAEEEVNGTLTGNLVMEKENLGTLAVREGNSREVRQLTSLIPGISSVLLT